MLLVRLVWHGEPHYSAGEVPDPNQLFSLPPSGKQGPALSTPPAFLRFCISEHTETSHAVAAGGAAFENFELRERFHEGQVFTFGTTRKTPAQLALGGHP
jgi:hypothetical protein